jgi:hypothetical protein
MPAPAGAGALLPGGTVIEIDRAIDVNGAAGEAYADAGEQRGRVGERARGLPCADRGDGRGGISGAATMNSPPTSPPPPDPHSIRTASGQLALTI